MSAFFSISQKAGLFEKKSFRRRIVFIIGSRSGSICGRVDRNGIRDDVGTPTSESALRGRRLLPHHAIIDYSFRKNFGNSRGRQRRRGKNDGRGSKKKKSHQLFIEIVTFISKNSFFDLRQPQLFIPAKSPKEEKWRQYQRM